MAGTKTNRFNDNPFEMLFKDHYQKVYKTAFFVVLDRELAYDATQEAFLQAYKKIGSLKDESKFGSWVCSIAVNVCKKMLRQKVIDRQRNISIYDTDGNMKEFIDDFNTLDYENIFIKQELVECINKCEADLRKIIYLKYYQGFTYEEVAEAMNIKEGTVKSRLYRVNRKIAKKIKNMNGFG